MIPFITKCSHCGNEFGPNQTPFAFPLNDMRFDSYDRFCSERCMREADAAQLAGDPTKEEA